MTESLIDTNVLIYATLKGDPRFAPAREVVLGDDSRWGRRFVSCQNLAEMYPTLTGPKTVPPDSGEVASAKIRALTKLLHLTVLPVTTTVVERSLSLCAEHGISRQRYFDAQIVAIMIEHGISRVFTENVRDFVGLASSAGITVVNPFAESS